MINDIRSLMYKRYELIVKIFGVHDRKYPKTGAQSSLRDTNLKTSNSFQYSMTYHKAKTTYRVCLDRHCGHRRTCLSLGSSMRTWRVYLPSSIHWWAINKRKHSVGALSGHCQWFWTQFRGHGKTAR